MPGIISWENINATQNPAEESNSLWGANLVELVRNGTVPESRLNDMVTRTMAAYYKLGQDNSYPDLNFDYGNPDQEATNSHVDVRANHADLIRRIGGASSVLLKNEASSLPLRDDSVGSIGVFGVDAGPDPNGLNACVDHACSNGTLAIGWGSGTANFTYLVDPLQGIQSYADSMFSLDTHCFPLITAIHVSQGTGSQECPQQ